MDFITVHLGMLCTLGNYKDAAFQEDHGIASQAPLLAMG